MLNSLCVLYLFYVFFDEMGYFSFEFADAFDLSLLDPQLVQLLALQRLQQLRSQLSGPASIAAVNDLQVKVKVEDSSDVTNQNGGSTITTTAAAASQSGDVKPSTYSPNYMWLC